MGQQKIDKASTSDQIRVFEKCLLDEVQALEHMIEQDMIEEDVRRIGAEQELFLIDETFRPCPYSMSILKDLNHPNITTELGNFNLEFNLEPENFNGSCLSNLEKHLERYIGKIRTVANKHKADVLLTGILIQIE